MTRFEATHQMQAILDMYKRDHGHIPKRYPYRGARNALGESLLRPLLSISLSQGTGDFRDQPPILLRKQRFAKKRDSRSARKTHQGRALTRPIRETEDQRLRDQREQSTEIL